MFLRAAAVVQPELFDRHTEIAGERARMTGRGSATVVLPGSHRPFGDAETLGHGYEGEGAGRHLGSRQAQLTDPIRHVRIEFSRTTVGLELKIYARRAMITVDSEMVAYVGSVLRGGSAMAERITGFDGAEGCDPALCALGTEPHAHCACGLPMAAGAALCDHCRSEGFNPKPLTVADYAERWDGQRYPSRRLHRPADIPAARYDDLLQAIFAPDEWRETQKERRKAA